MNISAFRSRSGLYALLLTLQGVLVVAPASANQYAKQVGDQLLVQGAFLVNMGYRLSHDLVISSLPRYASTSHYLDLDAGASYAIIGNCDGDCRDIDLRLIDPEGRIVDYDMEVDDLPMVSAKVYQTGRFRVEVIMSNCSASPCVYGLGVFGK
jgi:hypothetical protein